ncbi:hypothetical protein Q5752_000634 [Cryptotrichosporon argae]
MADANKEALERESPGTERNVGLTERRSVSERTLAAPERVHVDVEKEHDGTVVTFPDGGWPAWLVVIGACHALFATFGFVNSWGVYQQYYEETLFPDETESTIAWIGSLQYFFMFFPSLVMGRLLDLDKFQWPFRVAAIVFPVSVFLTAEVKEYYQALLAQGVLFGLAGGTLFCPAVAISGQYFRERRALAMGIVAAASSIGGVVFPVLVYNCLNRIGFKWTMRVCGFILLYATAFAAFTVRSRLPPKAVAGGILNPRAFREPSYSLYAAGSFLVMLGLYTPLTYFSYSGTELGLGSYPNYLVAIANATSLLGRIGPALIADRVGPVNIMIPGLLGSAITTFVWPVCSSKASLTAIAAVNGMFQGCFVSLLAPGVAQLGSTDDLGRRFGMISSICGFGCLIGPPISGAILADSSLHEVSYYAGCVVLAGTALMFASRWYKVGGWQGKM